MEVGASSADRPMSMATDVEHDSDKENNHLPPDLVQYINALSEPLSIYTRYMDALLIKRADHPAFFRDLKAFRCQPHIMALLTTSFATTATTAITTDAVVPSSSKELFLSVTNSFLASRYAHPWCRTSHSELKAGWFKAAPFSSSGNLKKQQDEARQREEQRLHKLLVPIWCGFRVRMMPTKEVLEKFVEDEEERRRRGKLVELGEGGSEDEKKQARFINNAPREGAEGAQTKPQLRKKQSRPGNAEAYCMELSDYDERDSDNDQGNDNDNENHVQNDSSAAAKLFVGVAATGFLASNKRARKYLFKKLNKKK